MSKGLRNVPMRPYPVEPISFPMIEGMVEVELAEFWSVL